MKFNCFSNCCLNDCSHRLLYRANCKKQILPGIDRKSISVSKIKSRRHLLMVVEELLRTEEIVDNIRV